MLTEEQFKNLKVGDKVAYIPTKRLLKKIREVQANAIRQNLPLQLAYPYCCSHCEGTVLYVFKNIKKRNGDNRTIIVTEWLDIATSKKHTGILQEKDCDSYVLCSLTNSLNINEII